MFDKVWNLIKQFISKFPVSSALNKEKRRLKGSFQFSRTERNLLISGDKENRSGIKREREIIIKVPGGILLNWSMGKIKK